MKDVLVVEAAYNDADGATYIPWYTSSVQPVEGSVAKGRYWFVPFENVGDVKGIGETLVMGFEPVVEWLAHLADYMLVVY